MPANQGPDIDPIRDARRVFEVLTKGGLAIIPVNVGYAICAGDSTALERAFTTKQVGSLVQPIGETPCRLHLRHRLIVPPVLAAETT